MGIGPLEIIIVLVIVLIIFGPKRLPDLGRSWAGGWSPSRTRSPGRRRQRITSGDAKAETLSAPRSPRPRPSRPSRPWLGAARAARRPPVQHDDRMSVVDHLGELRSRLFVSLVAFGVAFAFAGWQNERILEIVNEPLPKNLPEPITFGVTEAFTTTLTNSAYAAILIALPVILYELYAFVLPAFSPRSAGSPRRCCCWCRSCSSAGWCSVTSSSSAGDRLPPELQRDQFNTQVRARDYYSFVTLTMAAMGLGFQLPIGIVAVRPGSPRRRSCARTAATRSWARGGGGAAAHHRPGDDAARDGPAVPALRGLHRAGGLVAARSAARARRAS